MKLSKFEVQGFRSFKTKGTLYFAIPREDKCGLTLILGENNTGKTSLLEALKLRAHGSFNTLRSSDILNNEIQFSHFDENESLIYSLIQLRERSYKLKEVHGLSFSKKCENCGEIYNVVTGNPVVCSACGNGTNIYLNDYVFCSI